MNKDKLIAELSDLFTESVIKATPKDYDRASAFKDSIDVINVALEGYVIAPELPTGEMVEAGAMTVNVAPIKLTEYIATNAYIAMITTHKESEQ